MLRSVGSDVQSYRSLAYTFVVRMSAISSAVISDVAMGSHAPEFDTFVVTPTSSLWLEIV